jgi:uncharacterized phiE125 gp8 family phage protein
MAQKIELLNKSNINFISLKHAKQYLRVDHVYDDEIIQDSLLMVLSVAENYLGLQLQESIWKMTIFNNLPNVIKLSYAPITKIEQFKLFRHNGEITYLNSDHYIFSNFSETLKIRQHYSMQKAEITYHSGYSPTNLPAPIKQGMLEHLARIYDLRGSDNSLPLSAKSMYQAYKRVRL